MRLAAQVSLKSGFCVINPGFSHIFGRDELKHSLPVTTPPNAVDGGG